MLVKRCWTLITSLGVLTPNLHMVIRDLSDVTNGRVLQSLADRPEAEDHCSGGTDAERNRGLRLWKMTPCTTDTRSCVTSDQPWSKHAASIPNNTRQGTVNDARSNGSAAQMSKKKIHKQTLPFVFSGLESLRCSQWAVQATKPRPQKTQAFTCTHGFQYVLPHFFFLSAWEGNVCRCLDVNKSH